MPENMPPPNIWPEPLHWFENWLRTLSDGEATFYSIMLTALFAVTVWIGKRGWDKFKVSTSSTVTIREPSMPTPGSTPPTPPSSINAERQARLQEKLRQLYEQYDLETRVDEKMRLRAIIDATEKDLQGL